MTILKRKVEKTQARTSLEKGDSKESTAFLIQKDVAKFESNSLQDATEAFRLNCTLARRGVICIQTISKQNFIFIYD